MTSILYVFLPCKKVYPIGVTYLADFIHRRLADQERLADLLCEAGFQRVSYSNLTGGIVAIHSAVK